MKTKNKHRKVYVRLILVASVCIAGFLGIIGTNNGNGIEIVKPYFLGYMDENDQLRIRWSENGSAWQSSSMANTEIKYGPGITCDETGILFLSVFCTTDGRAQFSKTTRADDWENPSHIGNGHMGEIESAVSLIYLHQYDYVMAYLHDDRAKYIILNNTGTNPDFGEDITPVLGVTNNNLVDRPALVRLHDKVLAGWINDDNEIELVIGTIEEGVLTWTPGYKFSNTEEGFEEPHSVIDLASDNDKFYLACLRTNEHSDILEEYSVFIYTSADGLHWTKLTSRHIGVSRIRTLSIAANNADTIMLAESSIYFQRVMRYNGSLWEELSDEIVFGSNLNKKGEDLTLFKQY